MPSSPQPHKVLHRRGRALFTVTRSERLPSGAKISMHRWRRSRRRGGGSEGRRVRAGSPPPCSEGGSDRHGSMWKAVLVEERTASLLPEVAGTTEKLHAAFGTRSDVDALDDALGLFDTASAVVALAAESEESRRLLGCQEGGDLPCEGAPTATARPDPVDSSRRDGDGRSDWTWHGHARLHRPGAARRLLRGCRGVSAAAERRGVSEGRGAALGHRRLTARELVRLAGAPSRSWCTAVRRWRGR